MQNARQRAQQRSLPQAGHALEQYVTASQQTDENAVDDILLSYDDLRNFIANGVELAHRPFKSCIGAHESILCTFAGCPARLDATDL